MHLPADKIKLTWGQLEEILSKHYSGTEIRQAIDRVDSINSCTWQKNQEAKDNRPKVVAGQVWKDLDKRRPRTITISQVEGKNALYISPRGPIRFRISTKRLLERFELVH